MWTQAFFRVFCRGKQLPHRRERDRKTVSHCGRLLAEPLEARILLSHAAGHKVLAEFSLNLSDALALKQDASAIYWVDKGGTNSSDLHIRRINKDGIVHGSGTQSPTCERLHSVPAGDRCE